MGGLQGSLTVNLSKRLGPMDIGRFGLGQGGISPLPMWDDCLYEVRALRPKVIRLFVQEYFDVVPARGRYDWKMLDRSVDNILAAGAEPLLCLTVKPRPLFPRVDMRLVEPTDWKGWEDLVSAMVRHFQERGSGIRYWEVCNEPDIPNGGATPYCFTPDEYCRFYRHTALAIMKADPGARVGGPTVARWKAAHVPALLNFCEQSGTPIHFVSWHIYTANPQDVRASIDGIRSLLLKHPGLKVETVLDEWNSWELDRQHCFVAEATYQMKEGGLDLACFYHIREFHAEKEQWEKYMPPELVAETLKFCNSDPVFFGLFDPQRRVRPAYFTFKLLSRLTGERIPATSDGTPVHALAAYDEYMGLWNVLVWNWSDAAETFDVVLEDARQDVLVSPFLLDTDVATDEETKRIRLLPAFQVRQGEKLPPQTLRPHEVMLLRLQASA